MKDDDLNPVRTFVVGENKIHFTYGFVSNRQYCLCVLETHNHQFYSGVAIVSPNEYMKQDTYTGWKISLKRACEATNTMWFGEMFYKHFWHEIRSQLRDEKIKENLKKALEEENG